MELSRRSYQKELLDLDDIPFPDIERNMQELNIINTYLGGHSITIDGLKGLIAGLLPGRKFLICEIGCGGGDNLRAIDAWCVKNRVTASFIGIDINPDCVRVCRESSVNLQASFLCADYKEVQFETKPDIIFSSLFCHHFSNDEIVGMLRWLRKHSGIGFFINDLHRNPVAYYSIWFISRLFSKSYLVKNDAPLSVARGFSRLEWKALLEAANIVDYILEWKWAFRWLIVVRTIAEPVVHT